MGKRSRGAKATETRKVLVERFPKAFAPPGQDKRPLKVGIFRDLVGACPDLSKTKIGGALNDYTGGPTYLRNMVVGATRIDLRGDPSGTVDEKGAEHAAEKLAEITARKRPQPAEYDRATDDPGTEDARENGCTCWEMESVNSASIDPPEMKSDRDCPLHGWAPDPDEARDRKLDDEYHARQFPQVGDADF